MSRKTRVLQKIKTESQSNYLAKFIIMDKQMFIPSLIQENCHIRQ